MRDILVVLRSNASPADLIGEVFREYGIPIATEGSRALASSGRLAAVSALLHLAIDDWPYQQVLGVLGSNYFQPAWSEGSLESARESALALVRKLQVAQGSEPLIHRSAALIAGAERWEIPAQPDAPHPLADGHRLLLRLFATFELLPQRATVREWGEVLRKIAEEFGWLTPPATQKPSNADGAPWQSGDEIAWRAALQRLATLEHLGPWLGESPPRWSRRDFLVRWQDLLRCELLPDHRDEVGRVRVLSAPAARGLSAEYLFFAGLSEQSFPQPMSESRLLSEAEVAGLAKAGLPLSQRGERAQDEMLLFYEVLSRGRRHLTVSYPALDAAAQPLMPSPYLIELQQICKAAWPVAEQTLELSPLPVGPEPLCPRDLRLMAIAAAEQGESQWLARFLRRAGAPAGDSPIRTAADNVTAGLRMAHQRQAKEFGPFDGLILGEQAQRAFAAGCHAQRQWSASQLEQYRACPYQFFLRRELRLVPQDELELEDDYGRRGVLLHGALAALHRWLNEKQGGPTSLAKYEHQDLMAAAQRLLDELCGTASESLPLQQALREIDRRLLSKLLERYLRQHRAYEQGMKEVSLRPAYFEVAFGDEANPRDGEPALDARRDPLSTEQPFELRSGDETILLSGRIDRIDIGRAGDTPVFNIVDYKSGKSGKYTRPSVLNGRWLQLPLYTLAAAELLLLAQRAQPWQFGYWFPKEAGLKSPVVCHEVAAGRLQSTQQWSELRELIAKLVFDAVRGIARGQFPVSSSDPQCTSHCEYKTVCRVNQVRSIDKIWPPESPS